jgi:outer membrane protein assembly factor BamB
MKDRAWFLIGLALLAADWPQFRGPDSRALTNESVPTNLADSVAWKVDLPGRGLSSPIVIGQRVFLTSCTGQKQDQLQVLAFDTSTGKKLWTRTIWATGPAISHPKSCMAAPTPASDGRLLAALFATNDLVCLDLEGNVQWIRALYHEFPGASDGRGLASSPAIVAGTLIVQCDNQNNSFALGIDLASGKDRWKITRPKSTVWTTPITISDGTSTSIILQGATGLSARDPQTGKELWNLNRGMHPIASALLAPNMLYVPGENGLCAFGLRPASGAPKFLWEKPKLNPDMASPIVLSGKIYVLRGAILVSGDAKTGEITGQLRLKGAYSSSLIVAGGLIYCFNEDGQADVIKPQPKDATVLASMQLKERILCTPAVAGGALYVRSDHHLWKLAKKG